MVGNLVVGVVSVTDIEAAVAVADLAGLTTAVVDCRVPIQLE